MSKRNAAGSVLPVLMVAIGVLLILGAAVVIVYKPSETSATDQSPTSAAARIPYSDVPRFGLGDAKAAFDLGSAVFVDVRGEPYYSEGHIQGALLIPEGEISAYLDQLDPESWIITYCT